MPKAPHPRLSRKKETAPLTNTINLQLDPRAHDLVPAVYAPDQPPRAIETTRAAKRMHERGRRRKVCLHRDALLRWRRLRQRVDHGGDLGRCGEGGQLVAGYDLGGERGFLPGFSIVGKGGKGEVEGRGKVGGGMGFWWR